MAVIFSHNTALELLRAWPPQARALARVNDEMGLSALSTAPRDLAKLDLGALGIHQKPVHILVKEGNVFPRGKEYAVHRSRLETFPANSLMQLGEGVYVCGPELVFVQMSVGISEVGSAVLGHELCGRYSQFAARISGFYERPALTSVHEIAEVIGSLGRTRGVSAARAALKLVRDGSRSPMETVASCMLFMPDSVGGCGFVKPKLNAVVRLDDVARRVTGTKTCSIDLSWRDEKVGIEYDSATFHSDPEKDRRRREALAHMGWTIYVVELDNLRNYLSFAEKVNLFADRIPRTGRIAAPEEQGALLDRLLRATRFGMGLDAVLFAEKPAGKMVVHL